MPNLVLTDMTVRGLKAPGLYLDAKLSNFGIRVGKNRKTWLVIKGQNRTKVSLGQYPAISLQDARRRAMVTLGSPEQRAASLTFPEALDAYLEQGSWRETTKRVMRSTLKPFPWKGQLAKITHEDVAQALDAIEAPSMRFHAFKDIRTFFNWCVPRYLPSSPAAGIKMQAQPTRDRVLTDEELLKVWRAAEQIGHPFGTIVVLLILTGQRRSEIGSLKWDSIKSDRIELPASATKNGREHSFPLGTSATSILKSLSDSGSRKSATLLFPARGHTSSSFNGWSKSHAALLKLSGTSGWTLHDLRRTFATNLAALNVPIHVTEKLLNHVSGTTGGLVGVYQRHLYWEEQKAALSVWEEKLQSLSQ